MREDAEKAQLALKGSQKAFDMTWNVKWCAEVGESLHKSIK